MVVAQQVVMEALLGIRKSHQAHHLLQDAYSLVLDRG